MANKRGWIERRLTKIDLRASAVLVPDGPMTYHRIIDVAHRPASVVCALDDLLEQMLLHPGATTFTVTIPDFGKDGDGEQAGHSAAE